MTAPDDDTVNVKGALGESVRGPDKIFRGIDGILGVDSDSASGDVVIPDNPSPVASEIPKDASVSSVTIWPGLCPLVCLLAP
jgi:hypothetical protein